MTAIRCGIQNDVIWPPFDPAIHEAMVQVPTDEVPPNTCVDVYQKGYQLHDRMLRPARVTVSKPAEEG